MIAPTRSWAQPQSWPSLLENEVHVWRTSLDLPAAEIRALRLTLAEDEVERSGRFFFERDRGRYIVARSALRDILARYGGIHPSKLRFVAGPHGKPQLARDDSGPELTFSLSHSFGSALIAVSLRRTLGVDLERIRSNVDGLKIAGCHFAPEEVAALRSVPQSMQTEAFFHCWTCKEAYAKADGRGILLPLDQFVVSVMPRQPASLLETKWDPQEAHRWSIVSLDPWPGFAAALAVQGHGWRLQSWDWDRFRRE